MHLIAFFRSALRSATTGGSRYHAWMGILSWEGRSGDAGKTTGWSPLECTCSLNISPERFLQYVVYADVQDADPTSWSHALPTGRWTHLAVVNDSRQTTVHVDGSPIAIRPMFGEARSSTSIPTCTNRWPPPSGWRAPSVSSTSRRRVDLRSKLHRSPPNPIDSSWPSISTRSARENG